MGRKVSRGVHLFLGRSDRCRAEGQEVCYGAPTKRPQNWEGEQQCWTEMVDSVLAVSGGNVPR